LLLFLFEKRKFGRRKEIQELPHFCEVVSSNFSSANKTGASSLPAGTELLFPSGKTKEALSERALGYIVKKYARIARLWSAMAKRCAP